MNHPIVVTGAPGAGKTTLVAHLARELQAMVVLPGGLDASRRIDADKYQRLGVALSALPDLADHCIVETCAYGSPWQGEAASVVAVVDAVPLSGKAAALGEADAAAVAMADLVVLTRGDLVDAAAAVSLLAGASYAKILDVPHGKLSIGDLPVADARPVSLPAWPVPQVWSYAGGARMDAALAEQFLKNRPTGTLRIKGCVVSPTAGFELDHTGRARSVTPCNAPEETVLFAAGPKSTFLEAAMDLHFAEIASAGAATSGWFGFR